MEGFVIRENITISNCWKERSTKGSARRFARCLRKSDESSESAKARGERAHRMVDARLGALARAIS
jgi:hypothetical protein